jgi:hypothetical protein
MAHRFRSGGSMEYSLSPITAEDGSMMTTTTIPMSGSRQYLFLQWKGLADKGSAIRLGTFGCQITGPIPSGAMGISMGMNR